MSGCMGRLLRTHPFPTVWVVGFFQEVAFFLLVNLPGRFQQLGITEGGIGIAYSASALAALLLRPSFGRILDVVHRRTVLRVGGLANVSAILALALLDVPGLTMWSVFIAQRILQILLFTTLLTYAADALPADIRTQGLALFGLSGLIPIATSNLLGDALIASSGYPAVLLAAAASGLVSWALLWRLPLLPVLGRRPRRSFWAVVRQRDMLPLWWVTLMFAMALETVFTFMRTYVNTRRIGSLALFFGIYGLMAVATRIGGGSRYDRLPHRRVTVVAVVGLATGLAIVAVAPNTALLAGGAAILGIAHGAVFPILSSQVISRARTAERGSAVATFTSIFDVGLLVVAPVVGVLIELAGYGLAFSSVSVMLLAGAAVYALWDRRLVAASAG